MEHKDVFGDAYLSTNERVLTPGEIFSTEMKIETPSGQHIHAAVDDSSLYASRPKHPVLSVYEFWRHWNVYRLHHSIQDYNMEACNGTSGLKTLLYNQHGSCCSVYMNLIEELCMSL